MNIKKQKMMHGNKIMVLSPHTDDGEIGAGGTIARLVEEGKEIYYAAFSSCEDSLPAGFQKDTLKSECVEATGILGISKENVILLDYKVRCFPSNRQEILDEMIKLNKEISPDIVFVPSSYDTHQDHQVIYSEALRAFKKTSSIWGYEHPWNNLTFTSDIYVRLEEKHILQKINALKAYRSQDFRQYLDEKYIKAIAYAKGVEVNFPFAETFELKRLLVK